MWPFLFPWSHWYSKLCEWYYLYAVKETKESVINALESSSEKLFKWFSNNIMKANSDKSHLLMSCDGTCNLLIDCFTIESSINEVLLGVTIDKELKFDDHVNNLFKKACQKLKCSCTYCAIHEYWQKKINYESIHRVTVWLLPIDMDVP